MEKIHLPHRGDECKCRKTGYWWAFWMAALLFPLEFGGGSYFWSLALLADSWHVLTHLPFYAVAIYAFSRANKTRSGIFMADMLLVVALAGIAATPLRFLLPEVHAEGALAVSVAGLFINMAMFSFAHFMGDENEEDHVHEGVWLHILGDTAMSAVVVVSLLLMFTELPLSHKGIDAMAALSINLFLALQARKLKKKAMRSH